MAIELNFESVVSMIENMITGVGVFELSNGKITPVYFNEGLSRMLGYSMQETKMVFKNVRNSIIPEDLPVLDQAIIDVLKDDGAIDFERICKELKACGYKGNLTLELCYNDEYCKKYTKEEFVRKAYDRVQRLKNMIESN